MNKNIFFQQNKKYMNKIGGSNVYFEVFLGILGYSCVFLDICMVRLYITICTINPRQCLFSRHVISYCLLHTRLSARAGNFSIKDYKANDSISVFILNLVYLYFYITFLMVVLLWSQCSKTGLCGVQTYPYMRKCNKY